MIVTAEDYGHDPRDGGPWLTVCEHGNVMHHEASETAMRWAGRSAAWCGPCADHPLRRQETR